MSVVVVPKPAKALGSPLESFEYGWRDIRHEHPDGTVEYERVALTAADVLYPQEGDVILERTRHNTERGYLATVFQSRTQGRQLAVFSDLSINWGIPGLGNPCPDVSAFEGIEHPEEDRASLDATAEGAVARLMVELVWPRNKDPQSRANDTVNKLADYHRAGVPVYVIVDQERENGPRRIVAHQHTPAEYVLIPLDDRGRFYLDLFDVWIGVLDNWVVCWNGQTGAEIPYPAVMYEKAAAAEEGRRAAEQKVQVAQERATAAEAARQASEQQLREAQDRAAALETRLRELEAKLQGQPTAAPESPPTP